MKKTQVLKVGLLATVALAVACGSNNGGSDAGTDGGSAGTPDSGAGATDAGSYCDGFGAKDSTSGDTILVNYYSFSSQLKTEGCETTIEGWADGQAVTQVGGIYDLDTSDNVNGAEIFPGNCGDLGLSGFTAPTASTITPPSGASTVAAAVTAHAASGVTMYGVVTALYGWTAGVAGADGGTAGKSGLMYVQDATTGTPVAGSGIEVYVPAKAAALTVPAVGDVVSITGLGWSPYDGVNQFEATSGGTLTVLGTSPLPTPVMLTPAEIGTTSLASPTYEGMRVIVSGSYTVAGSGTSMTCPAGVQHYKGG